MPSRTSTNFSLAFPVAELKHSANNTANVLTCSHLPFPNFSHSSCRPSASSVAHSTFVNRCLPVIHSVLRTMACGTSRVERTARVTVDLPVADMPWITSVDGLEMPGYVAPNVSKRMSSSFHFITWLLPREEQQTGGKTHAEQTSQLPDLELSTRPLLAEQAGNL